jgi:hypothetical protein
MEPLEPLLEPAPQTLRRYDGEERRRPFAEYVGEERRIIDPPTEQDHADIWAALGEPN